MAITNGYATLAVLKARLDIAAATTTYDSILENVIEAVSRWIDHWTGRRFYAVTETRYFSAEWPTMLEIDDLLSVTSLKTDKDGDRVYEDTWAATDYDREPLNASLDAQPYTRLRVTPNGQFTFPAVRKGVEIAGSWGYAATTPDQVNEACLIQSSRVYQRKDAPFGIAGAPEIGQTAVIPRLDPDVKMLLDAFQRVRING